MANKPSIPKGTRDFSPRAVVRRNHIFSTIQSVFESHGYQPIETPAMETLETLLGKYGEEGDKLIFRILNSGDYLGKSGIHELIRGNQHAEDLSDASRELAGRITEKALRYDLTVPFARYVVQHRNEITLPFRRYQIQPVWRADRPQKGRYREFIQCDVDVIGSDSLINEVELLSIIDRVFALLDIKVSIRVNNRKVLAGLASFIQSSEKLTDLTVAIDKLDKIGEDGVRAELIEKGIDQNQVDKLMPLIGEKGSWRDLSKRLEPLFIANETAMKGLQEIGTVFSLADEIGIKAELVFDLSLARGLSYYTGAIIEVKVTETEMGSVCGGGRYDNLTGIFGMPDMSGVGVSFGADRIYDVLETLNRFPATSHLLTQVIILNFGDEFLTDCFKLASDLRQLDLKVEVYPDAAKVKKQMQYADANQIPLVIMMGEDEKAAGSVTLKDMRTGKQQLIPLINLHNIIPEWIA